MFSLTILLSELLVLLIIWVGLVMEDFHTGT